MPRYKALMLFECAAQVWNTIEFDAPSQEDADDKIFAIADRLAEDHEINYDGADFSGVKTIRRKEVYKPEVVQPKHTAK